MTYAGGEDGILSLFDNKNQQRVSEFKVDDDEEITAVFAKNQLQVMTGSSEGVVKLFDLRYSGAVRTMRHPYMMPINTIVEHKSSGKIITADEKSVRISDSQSGKLFTTIEPKFKINAVMPYIDSGMLFMPCQNRRIGTYFVPSLGKAPKWASFLENVTEEMEETQKDNVYDEFRFLTMQDLEKINGSHLLGSKFLKSYMHGFIIKAKLHDKLKAESKPFDLEEYK